MPRYLERYAELGSEKLRNPEKTFLNAKPTSFSLFCFSLVDWFPLFSPFMYRRYNVKTSILLGDEMNQSLKYYKNSAQDYITQIIIKEQQLSLFIDGLNLCMGDVVTVLFGNFTGKL